eukprot:TRINITY_DN830_c4_g1_i1.p1 TRINITY_DN830_c4_g1~~TRINITY_DN830_c4_g1_i1.p1  ORF type:complete len:387 (+),score=114.65 TRINITY_DN830_c4_g1_i1:87-1247(+)
MPQPSPPRAGPKQSFRRSSLKSAATASSDAFGHAAEAWRTAGVGRQIPDAPNAVVPERDQGSPRRVSLNVYGAEQVPLTEGSPPAQTLRRHSLNRGDAAGGSDTRFYSKNAKAIVLNEGEDMFDVQKLRRTSQGSPAEQRNSVISHVTSASAQSKGGSPRLARGRASVVHQPMQRLQTTKATVPDSRHMTGRKEERPTYTLPTDRKGLPVVLYKDAPAPSGSQRRARGRKASAGEQLQQQQQQLQQQQHHADAAVQTEDDGADAFRDDSAERLQDLVNAEAQWRRTYRQAQAGDRASIVETLRGAVPVLTALEVLFADAAEAEGEARAFVAGTESRGRAVLRLQLSHAVLSSDALAREAPLRAELSALQQRADRCTAELRDRGLAP